jgi:hypothetical protein
VRAAHVVRAKIASALLCAALAAAGPASAAGPPSLAEFWDGRAVFVQDVTQTGQPMGESDTLLQPDGSLRSYIHASHRSARVTDSCGAPVEFPGCVVLLSSIDDGRSFHAPAPPACLIPCAKCPCSSERDHIDQQQYPRVHFDGRTHWMVYEWRGRVFLRSSRDGLVWSLPTHVADSLHWKTWLRPCKPPETIGAHPFVNDGYECLRGGPPGLFVENDTIYVFIPQGQNPGSLGCFTRRADQPRARFAPCRGNPLITGAGSYGPLDAREADARPFFDFRTVSSAEIVVLGVGENRRYYMLYEGIRGPGPGDPGDSQFGLGLARSTTAAIDGPWEKYPGNPILVDMPGNIGLGHADLVVISGTTYLYTSANGWTRGRFELRWKSP